MGMFDDVLNNVGEPYKGGKGFEYGTHEVVIGTAKATGKDIKAQKNAAVIEVEVFDAVDESKTATATLYFHTENGAKMSLTKVLGIMVHNVGEEKKDAVRELGKKLFAKVEDPTEARDIAAKLMNDKFVGKYKAFLVVEPQGTYKTSSYGDLWHYEAEPETKPVEAAAIIQGEDITKEITADDLPDFGDL